jgi:hypothetical protein
MLAVFKFILLYKQKTNRLSVRRMQIFLFMRLMFLNKSFKSHNSIILPIPSRMNRMNRTMDILLGTVQHSVHSLCPDELQFYTNCRKIVKSVVA